MRVILPVGIGYGVGVRVRVGVSVRVKVGTGKAVDDGTTLVSVTTGVAIDRMTGVTGTTVGGTTVVGSISRNVVLESLAQAVKASKDSTLGKISNEKTFIRFFMPLFVHVLS